MNEMREEFIAPCGMNCRLCMANQREKNQCKGCRSESDIRYKTKGSTSCVIKNCPVIQSYKSGFCFKCDKFPCQRLKQLDKRYRTKYLMSMLEILDHIKQYGMDAFLQNEEIRWTYKEYGNIVCVHKLICVVCKTPYIK
ncbi:MAG TPA: DUF3795 domain-containing protein [Desulfosporosinus sp.]|nr:MAG: hypothetical protein JL57_25345 [Desulfosporosinus sp. BICA1-9]HBW35361.1 DUF3795 domain-containing protein [Desulfosporosinus sp.]